MKKRVALLCSLVYLSAVTACAQESLPFVDVRGGTFVRGVEGGEDNPLDEVTVSSFRMARYEVSFALYAEFFEFYRDAYEIGGFSYSNLEVLRHAGINDSLVEIPGDWPAFYVGYFDAIEFCNWLSERDGFEPVYSIEEVERLYPGRDFTYSTLSIAWDREANGYRLPTEAEWEYAARAGNQDDHIVQSQDAERLDAVAWYSGCPDGSVHRVGQKKPNSFGIYDMIGNVSEWAWDFYQPDYYLDSPDKDPTGPEIGDGPLYPPEIARVIRGGLWATPIEYVVASERAPSGPNDRSATGIRLVRSVR